MPSNDAGVSVADGNGGTRRTLGKRVFLTIPGYASNHKFCLGPRAVRPILTHTKVYLHGVEEINTFMEDMEVSLVNEEYRSKRALWSGWQVLFVMAAHRGGLNRARAIER
ncbi:hypothetical protein M0804_001265 [Polistes exclamans]|nr:hypothetical protein M0804_001265 [Polistes exclamans]